MSAPAHTVLRVQQFLTKTSMTPMLHPPYSPDLTLSDFFFVSLDEKIPQREMLCQCGRGGKKWQNVLKGIKTNEFKNCVEHWKTVSMGVLHQMESTLKVSEV